jgi:hypothetical protein
MQARCTIRSGAFRARVNASKRRAVSVGEGDQDRGRGRGHDLVVSQRTEGIGADTPTKAYLLPGPGSRWVACRRSRNPPSPRWPTSSTPEPGTLAGPGRRRGHPPSRIRLHRWRPRRRQHPETVPAPPRRLSQPMGLRDLPGQPRRLRRLLPPQRTPTGTCEEALDTACGLYLSDPAAWLTPPKD